jgi:hypothetical protein
LDESIASVEGNTSHTSPPSAVAAVADSSISTPASTADGVDASSNYFSTVNASTSIKLTNVNTPSVNPSVPPSTLSTHFGGYSVQVAELTSYVKLGLNLLPFTTSTYKAASIDFQLPRGVLLYGPLGVGKTLLMQLLASHVEVLGCKVFVADCSLIAK